MSSECSNMTDMLEVFAQYIITVQSIDIMANRVVDS